MGQVLYGSATTTQAVRLAIQRSEASVRALALRHGVSPTTVQKWRRRQTTDDVTMGPKQPQSSVLSASRRPWSSPSAAIPCCRSTTASTPYSPASPS